MTLVLLVLDVSPATADTIVEDTCSSIPIVCPSRSEEGPNHENHWYSPDKDCKTNSFCAGWGEAKEASSDNVICKKAIKPNINNKPIRWREGFLYFYRNNAPVSGLQINSDNECLDGVLDPPAGLIQQCMTSLFLCDLRNPYSGLIILPRVDLGGIYLYSTGPVQQFDIGLSGGFTAAYWWSPKNISFRLVTAGVSVVAGGTSLTVPDKNSPSKITEQNFSVLRLGALVSLLQSVIVLEGGGYYIATADRDIGTNANKAFFVRFALNLADLPNLKTSDAALEAGRLLTVTQAPKPHYQEPEESGVIR